MSHLLIPTLDAAAVTYMPGAPQFAALVSSILGNAGDNTDGFDAIFSAATATLDDDSAAVATLDDLVAAGAFTPGAFAAANFDPISADFAALIPGGDTQLSTALLKLPSATPSPAPTPPPGTPAPPTGGSGIGSGPDCTDPNTCSDYCLYYPQDPLCSPDYGGNNPNPVNAGCFAPDGGWDDTCNGGLGYSGLGPGEIG